MWKWSGNIKADSFEKSGLGVEEIRKNISGWVPENKADRYPFYLECYTDNYEGVAEVIPSISETSLVEDRMRKEPNNFDLCGRTAGNFLSSSRVDNMNDVVWYFQTVRTVSDEVVNTKVLILCSRLRTKSLEKVFQICRSIS